MEIVIKSVAQLQSETTKLVNAGARKILKGTSLPLGDDYVGVTTGKLSLIQTKGTDKAPEGFIIYSGLVEVTQDGKKTTEAVSCIDTNEAASLLSVGQTVAFEVVNSDKINPNTGEPYKQVRLVTIQLAGNESVTKTKAGKKAKVEAED
jgi:hypothetical protein